MVSTERSVPLISYQHHQSWIVVAIPLPQALDFTLHVGKCRRFVRQKCAVAIVLFSSVRPPDGEKISGHCYLIETCPHAREASCTQSMKVTCRDCANACSEFLPRRQQCFGHCEPTRDLRPNHACEPFALENFATVQLAMLAAIRPALVAGQQLGRSRPHSITPRRRAVGAAPDCTDVGRRPPRQINHDSLSTQWLTACYQEAGAERGNNGPMQFITAIQRNRH